MQKGYDLNANIWLKCLALNLALMLALESCSTQMASPTASIVDNTSEPSVPSISTPPSAPEPTSTPLPLPTLSLTITPAAVVFLSDESQLLPLREYRPFDFDHDPWLDSFVQQYAAALQNHEPWLQDPIAVALRLAGFPNPDGRGPDGISAFFRDASHVSVVIVQDPIQDDDSLAAIENRIELVRKGPIWEVAWAGGRYRCQPGRGQRDWQPRLCR